MVNKKFVQFFLLGNNFIMYALSTAHGSPLICATLLSFVFDIREAMFPMSLGSTSETISSGQRKLLNTKSSKSFDSVKLTVYHPIINSLVVQLECCFDISFRCELNICFHCHIFDNIDAFFTIHNFNPFEKVDHILLSY